MSQLNFIQYIFNIRGYIIGSKYSDSFRGNDQDNSFHGLGGNDTFEGSKGNDELIGGDGRDSIRYNFSPLDQGVNVNLAANSVDKGVGNGVDYVSGIEVVVVDAGGASHTQTTDANGAAAFSGLAPGNRRSITARSAETAPAMPGAGGGQRPRFETTTILDHCSDRITVPLRLTASGPNWLGAHELEAYGVSEPDRENQATGKKKEKKGQE